MCWDFSGGPVVKNLLGNAGDMGWIPGWGTKIPHAVKQLSTSAAYSEPHSRQPCATTGVHVLKQKIPRATIKTRHSQTTQCKHFFKKGK